MDLAEYLAWADKKNQITQLTSECQWTAKINIAHN